MIAVKPKYSVADDAGFIVQYIPFILHLLYIPSARKVFGDKAEG